MKKRAIPVLAIVVASILALRPAVTQAGDDPEVRALRVENKVLKFTIDQCNKEIAALKNDAKRLVQEQLRLSGALDQRNKDIAAVNGEVESLKERRVSLNSTLDQRNKEIAALKAEVEALQAKLAQPAAAAARPAAPGPARAGPTTAPVYSTPFDVVNLVPKQLYAKDAQRETTLDREALQEWCNSNIPGERLFIAGQFVDATTVEPIPPGAELLFAFGNYARGSTRPTSIWASLVLPPVPPKFPLARFSLESGNRITLELSISEKPKLEKISPGDPVWVKGTIKSAWIIHIPEGLHLVVSLRDCVLAAASE